MAQTLTVASDINWYKLNSLGMLRFEGADTQGFLQGQLTSNVQALANGRLLACLLLWQRNGAYHMILPRELCEGIRKRLSMYILRAKVTAADVSGTTALFGLSGTAAA